MGQSQDCIEMGAKEKYTRKKHKKEAGLRSGF